VLATIERKRLLVPLPFFATSLQAMPCTMPCR
jgi:hypothetical protein